MFLFVFSILFTGIREAECNPLQTSQPLCLQIPFSSMKEAETPAEVHLICPCGLQLLPIYHIWNKLTLVASVKWTETLGLLLSYFLKHPLHASLILWRSGLRHFLKYQV